MKNTNDIEQKIDETLKSLEGIEQANISPFFYTRLEARLHEKHSTTHFYMKPAFIWSFLTLTLLLNVAFVINSFKNSPSNNEQNSESFAQEYGLRSDINL